MHVFLREFLRVYEDSFWSQVFQVRKKDTGQIYAMKVMRKEKVLEKEHGDYVKAESEILKTVLHPYIVTLRYSFQVCALEIWKDRLLTKLTLGCQLIPWRNVLNSCSRIMHLII